MKTGFENPIEAKPKKSVKTPWNFESPDKDERYNVAAGTHYGVGHRNPVGHTGDPKVTCKCLPKGRVKTLDIYENPSKVEIE